MPSPERKFAVWLQDQRTGILHARDDYTWFAMDASYIADPTRGVLGLSFEQDLRARHRANMRLPPWFSNLLPEGPLRAFIAEDRGISPEREMELLAQIGHDLPGAVRVLPTDESLDTPTAREIASHPPRTESASGWRFSLAGVQLKFSMLASGDRFTAPAAGEGGDWIVKLPDAKFPHVPSNEFAMMELARKAGIDVPETKLVHRDELDAVPSRLWPPDEAQAFAVRRFDRLPTGGRVHMEDLAQVRGFYPQHKYDGTFETVANLIYRRHDRRSLLEFVRRLAFNVLIRNGDAHLKNWSLLYRNPRVPELSPAYDLVATSVYRDVPEDLGLRFGGSRRFENISLATFGALQRKLGVTNVSFEDEAAEVVQRAVAAWPEVRQSLLHSSLTSAVDMVIAGSATSLLRQR
jgi:serine/threonine-protein kinase HipA